MAIAQPAVVQGGGQSFSVELRIVAGAGYGAYIYDSSYTETAKQGHEFIEGPRGVSYSVDDGLLRVRDHEIGALPEGRRDVFIDVVRGCCPLVYPRDGCSKRRDSAT